MKNQASRWTLLALLALPLLAGCSSQPSAQSAEFAHLGDAMFERGDTTMAADFYRRALSHDEDNLSALRGLLVVQQKAGDKEGALKTAEAAVKLAPEDPALQRELGRLLLAQEKPMEAKKAFAAALKHDPQNPKLLGEMAVSLDYLSEHTEAQSYYAKALALDSGNASLINNLAYSYILEGNLDEAIRILEPLLKDPRATPALRQNLALAYGLSGMETDAERVAKMDLPRAKVKEALSLYKRRRAETIVVNSPYVELGSYPTEAMAEGAVARLLPRILQEGGDMKPVIAPEVSAPGGTPRFSLRLMSCAKPEELQKFCADLVKSGVPCHPFGG